MRKQRGLSDAAAAAFVTPNTREAGGGGGRSVRLPGGLVRLCGVHSIARLCSNCKRFFI